MKEQNKQPGSEPQVGETWIDTIHVKVKLLEKHHTPFGIRFTCEKVGRGGTCDRDLKELSYQYLKPVNPPKEQDIPESTTTVKDGEAVEQAARDFLFKLDGSYEDTDDAFVGGSQFGAHWQSTQQQAELEKLYSIINKLQRKYDENGYDCSAEIKLQRIDDHIDTAVKIYQSRIKDQQAEIERMRDEITLLQEYNANLAANALNNK